MGSLQERIERYDVGFGVSVEVHLVRENAGDVFVITICSGSETLILPSSAAPGTQLAIQEAYASIMQRTASGAIGPPLE
jgi:hypothetical protein